MERPETPAEAMARVLLESEPERRERFAGYYAVLRELDPAEFEWMVAFAHVYYGHLGREPLYG